MSSPADNSKSSKPRTRQSYVAPSIPPPLPDSSLVPLSLHPPSLRTDPKKYPHTCSPNPFEPLSPNPIPTTKQTYASPSTPPLKTPFNIVASSFPPLASPSNQSKYRPPNSQETQAPKEDHSIELPKDSWNFILWIEPEYQHKTDTFSLVRQLIPLRWEHPKTKTLKTQKFYEFILVGTFY